jgi:hypothetical protein
MNFFITHWSTFDSKVLLTLKIMDFENVPHIYVIGDMKYNIHDIKSNCSQNIFISKMQC